MATVKQSTLEIFAHAYKFGEAQKPSEQAIENITNTVHNLYFDYCDKGITFEFVDYEPYQDYGEMLYKFRKNNHLLVSTLHNESIFDKETNLLFRAVHDMHHIEYRAGFDFSGELFCARYFMNSFFRLEHQLEERQILFSEIALQAAFALYYGEFALEQKVVYCGRVV